MSRVQDRITKRAVEALEPAIRDVYLWDDKLPGFGVKVTPAGARIYVLKYRHAGSQRWFTIGRHGDVTADKARDKAIRLRGVIAEGKDPAAIRDARSVEPIVD